MSHHLLPFGQTLFETRCCSESWLFFALWKKNPKPKQFQDWVSDALWSLWLNSEVGSGRIWEMMSSCAVLGPVLLFSWVTAVPDSVDKQTTVEKALNCLRLFWEVFFGLVFFSSFWESDAVSVLPQMSLSGTTLLGLPRVKGVSNSCNYSPEL